MLAAVALLLTLPVQDHFVVSTDWLSQHLGQTRVIVVEVGDEVAYQHSHIPGARFLDRDDLLVWSHGIPDEVPAVDRLEKLFTKLGIGDTARVVFYSRNPLLATRAWFTLDSLCHGHRASILDGGWDRWVDEGRPVSAAPPAYGAIPFTAFLSADAVAPAERVKALVRMRGRLPIPIVLVDARASQEFTGAAPGREIERPGHLPDAKNVPWTANLAEEGTLRPQTQLRQMYESIGVSESAVVITYCRTGVEASMTYFVLRYLGYDVALYDGSYYEWSRAADTAVVMLR